MTRYTLILRPEPAGRDHCGREPATRLRLLLKMLLRMFGFRCVSVEEMRPTEKERQK
jgi:hypothetical protein